MAQHEKIGVGIVGLSANRGWGAEAHLPALRALEDRFSVVALSGSTQERAEAAGAKYGIANCYASPADVALDPAVDLVAVTVRVPEHLAICTAAIQAGKHVYCEWPLGRDAKEARALADMAKARGVMAVIGLQARLSPVVRHLHDLVRSGYVGEVLSTTLVGSGGVWGEEVEAANAYLNDRANGATMLSIPFGHTIDALNYVLGEWDDARALLDVRQDTIRLIETGEVIPKTAPDQIVVSGRLESGAVVAAHYRAGVNRSTNLLWEINGTEGDLRVTGPLGHIQLAPLTLHGARGNEPMTEMPIPEDCAVAPEVPDGRAFNVGQIYAQFARDLRTGSRELPDFDLAVRRHEFLDRLIAGAD